MTESNSQSVSQADKMVPCPSCGMFIEPVEICYYCCTATSPKRRIKETTLILWSLLVLGVGVVVLVLASFSETPVTPIAALSQGGAFNHFRVKGEVTRTFFSDTPYDESDLFSFWVADDSVKGKVAELKVKVDGPVYLTLQAKSMVPKKGMKVDVEGTLYAGDGFRLLSLNTDSMLRLESEPAQTKAPAGGAP